MSFTDSINNIEELSMNAWPSFNTLFYDGWIIRMADGYTKRSNSVSPLYQSHIDLSLKIEYCESFFSDHNLPVIFKMTDIAVSTGLNKILEKRGYSIIDTVSVQTADLSLQPPRLPPEGFKIHVEEKVNNIWADFYAHSHNLSQVNHDLHVRLLQKILPKALFIRVIDENGRIIGCGLGVCERGYLGIFDVFIDAEFRKRGLGVYLMHSLMQHGISLGARKAYLQVMTNNHGALILYDKLGFKELYKYWYMVK